MLALEPTLAVRSPGPLAIVIDVVGPAVELLAANSSAAASRANGEQFRATGSDRADACESGPSVRHVKIGFSMRLQKDRVFDAAAKSPKGDQRCSTKGRRQPGGCVAGLT